MHGRLWGNCPWQKTPECPAKADNKPIRVKNFQKITVIIAFFFYEDTGILEALSLVTSFILWFNLTEFSQFLSSFEKNCHSLYMNLLLILSIGIGKSDGNAKKNVNW